MPGRKGPHHTDAWHRCVEQVGDKVDSPEAVCTWSLERTDNVYEENIDWNEYVKSHWGSIDKMIDTYKSEMKKKKEDDFGNLPKDVKDVKLKHPNVPDHTDAESGFMDEHDKLIHKINKKELLPVYTALVEKAVSLHNAIRSERVVSSPPNMQWYRQAVEVLSPIIKQENDVQLVSANTWYYSKILPTETMIQKMEQIVKSRKPWYIDPYLTTSPEKSKTDVEVEADMKVVEDAITAHEEIRKAFRALDEK